MVAAASSPGILRDVWLIAALPVASGVLTLFFGKRTPGRGYIYGVAAIGAGFVMSVLTLWHFVQGGGVYTSSASWFSVGTLHLQLGQYVDGLTAAMLVVVTGISLCVHVYSVGYMHDDERFTWFYFVLSIFTAAMLNVVIADNLFQLLVGWEVMGVCSYLLIGHWWEDHANSSAAIKAFITTRIGDVPFLFGIFALTFATGFKTSNIQAIGQIAAHPAANHTSTLLISAAALLLFGGTIGKSAQFPLYVWLPDAMAGPTPVSALIHAATMVAAGVYLVGRMFQVFVHADPVVLQVVAVIGGITMVLSALLAIVQTDIKRVLAYSTVSQLAYMVAALSMGPAGYTAGLFHLFTHAFFKGLLFLGSGAVIHAVHSNDMREMGGLRKYLPITFVTFLIGSAALAGIVPFAGFWSKDEIIAVAFRDHHYLLFLALVVTAILTAFYMTRAVLMTFYGEYRGHGHPHEAPVSMTGPLVALAGASCLVGFLGAPQLHSVFADWVHFGPLEHASFDYPIALLSTLGALFGIGVGWVMYSAYKERDPVEDLGPAYTLLENKYYLDDIYMKGIIFPVRDQLANAVYWTNQHILDGVVNGMAVVAKGFSALVMLFDRDVIDGAVNGAAHTAGQTGGLLKYIQSGNVQRYAAILFVGVIALVIVFTRVA